MVVKPNATNIKQYLVDNNADLAILHALKMLKRHFYVDITNNSMNAVLAKLQAVRNNTLKVYKGLQAQLDISIEAFLLYDADNLPEWFDAEKFKPLPLPQKSSWSPLARMSLFAVASAAVASAAYYGYTRYYSMER